MSSTVTSVTVSTISSAVGLAVGLGLIAVLTLIGFLVLKELTSAGDHPRLRLLSRLLNVAIIPLFVVFVSVVVARALEVL